MYIQGLIPRNLPRQFQLDPNQRVYKDLLSCYCIFLVVDQTSIYMFYSLCKLIITKINKKDICDDNSNLSK